MGQTVAGVKGYYELAEVRRFVITLRPEADQVLGQNLTGEGERGRMSAWARGDDEASCKSGSTAGNE